MLTLAMCYCNKHSQSTKHGGPEKEASALSQGGKEVFPEGTPLGWVYKAFIRMTREGEAYFRCVQK